MNSVTPIDTEHMRTILQARTHQGAKKVLTEAMHGAQTDAKPVFPHFLPLNLMKKRAAQGKLELLNVPLEEPTRPQQGRKKTRGRMPGRPGTHVKAMSAKVRAQQGSGSEASLAALRGGTLTQNTKLAW